MFGEGEFLDFEIEDADNDADMESLIPDEELLIDALEDDNDFLVDDPVLYPEDTTLLDILELDAEETVSDENNPCLIKEEDFSSNEYCAKSCEFFHTCSGNHDICVKQAVKDVLNRLGEREARVLKLRYGYNGKPLTLEAIGEDYNVTKERVRLWAERATRKLRHPKRIKNLDSAIVLSCGSDNFYARLYAKVFCLSKEEILKYSTQESLSESQQKNVEVVMPNIIGKRIKSTIYGEGIITNEEDGAYNTEESCLSLLGGPRPCKRYKSIKVKYQTLDLQPRIKTFTGWTAQIIQHEVDHCDGILI